ncbi:MAG: DUF1552 domain-containing protein [Deltaproteobacteria bacterium]|nr:DUF1552 domain-containing protein [Deltaproteobacteria bacterium]
MQPRCTVRRQFLRGAGGLVLGLPWLPSLCPSRALAASSGPKRFVAFTSEHGAVAQNNFCPPQTAAPQRQEILPGFEVRYGDLVGAVTSGQRVLSPVLTASSTVLTDRLLSKMNVLRGFDYDFYLGHHQGGHLGNTNARVDASTAKPMQTVDQLLAWSKKFYPDVTGIRQRSMVTGQNFRGISFGYSNPSASSGTIQAVRTETSSKALFDSVMMNVKPPTMDPVMARKPIVDRVLLNYKALRESNRRLSKEDKQRLDDHIGRLAELERKFTVKPTISCSVQAPSADSRTFDNDRRTDPRFFSLVNDVIAMAFACDTSRLASVCIISTFILDYGGNWHQDVAHRAAEPDPQALLVKSHQATFESTILDLAAKLDSIEDSPGVSVLDNTLVQWTQESGPSTHDAQGLPVVTFGGASGYFKTGKFVDYRCLIPTAKTGFGEYLGLPYRRWLANVLMSMGLSPSDYESGGIKGYGDAFSDTWFSAHVPKDSRGSTAGDPLPIVTG